MEEMSEAWSFEHSEECPVEPKFAWRFWTDVNNWRLDADLLSVELHGPFATGSRGVTESRSSGRIEWLLTDVQNVSAVIEVAAPGAIARFRWTFEDLHGATRMTQRVSLEGEGAEAYVSAIASSLEAGIPAGMRALCKSMAEASTPP